MQIPSLQLRRYSERWKWNIVKNETLGKWTERDGISNDGSKAQDMAWIRVTKSSDTDAMDLQVNVPKTRRTYCKGKDCKKHTQHKVTQYKAGKVRTPAYF